MPPDEVRITWFDCTYADVQVDVETARRNELIIMTTHGCLVDENKKHITLGTDWIEKAAEFRHVFMIPWVNVLKYEKCVDFEEVTERPEGAERRVEAK